MSLKIRLKRMGMKKQPSYRIVVADARKPRDGKSIEILGSYAPQRKDKPLVLDMEKVEKWLAVGAQPTESAKKLLDKAKKVADETGEKKVTITSKPKERKAKPKPEPEPAAEVDQPEEAKTEETIEDKTSGPSSDEEAGADEASGDSEKTE